MVCWQQQHSAAEQGQTWTAEHLFCPGCQPQWGGSVCCLFPWGSVNQPARWGMPMNYSGTCCIWSTWPRNVHSCCWGQWEALRVLWLLQEQNAASASLLNMPVSSEWGIGKLSGVGVALLTAALGSSSGKCVFQSCQRSCLFWSILKLILQISQLCGTQVEIYSEDCRWWLWAKL